MPSYLQVENISKSYGPKVLFENISFNINEGDKIALIAPNGTGKSSLLSILAGKDTSDRGGEIKFLKNIVISFLEQETRLDPGRTILEEVISNVDPARTHRDSWDIEQDARQILSSLGLNNFDCRCASLSGGEAKRVALAGVLITNADFLVLDEPTNHLDLDAIEYLEDYLSKSRRTLFMVTHDRYFLDRVCNTILELDGGNLYTYKGNYQYYLEKRQERLEVASALNEKYRNIYRRELEWMRSTPCARTGKARYRENAFYDLQEKAAPIRETRQLAINLGSARLGRKIVNCRGVGFSYGDRPILKDFTYNFSQGEKIGIVGANGIGKSTFLNLLTGTLQPDEGVIDRGETIRFGYYRQEGMQFKEHQTVLEAVREIAEEARDAGGNPIAVTSFLQQFLFPVEMFNTHISRLSGGEKRRLYLLTVLMQRPNVLILDEPANDLDIVTLNVLENYLKDYAGNVIMVSHDRFFLDKIADHLFVFTGDGNVKDFVGTYSEYREYMQEKRRAEARAARAEKPAAAPREKPAPSQDKKKLSWKEQREKEQIEADLPKLEERKAALEEELSSGTLDIATLTAKSREIEQLINDIDAKELRWLELSLE
ncbi:MAG: ABC-F family ATP-binding cassette domain-containing protein [Bacteroidales bacterium]|nr:ABC-F family ATP-binding cassette domain-containing protein [Bacteroidales bacterium]